MDIYVRPLEGGTAVRITDLPGDKFQPEWSPDGTEIAFTGDGPGGRAGAASLVVSADGGIPVLIASGPGYNDRPVWSPSGLEIAFRSTRTGRNEAWLVSRETVGGPWSEPVQLTDFGCLPEDWAPDGSGVLCRSGAELMLLSREGEILWRFAASFGSVMRVLACDSLSTRFLDAADAQQLLMQLLQPYPTE